MITECLDDRMLSFLNSVLPRDTILEHITDTFSNKILKRLRVATITFDDASLEQDIMMIYMEFNDDEHPIKLDSEEFRSLSTDVVRLEYKLFLRSLSLEQ